jgi:hypothetical protein
MHTALDSTRAYTTSPLMILEITLMTSCRPITYPCKYSGWMEQALEVIAYPMVDIN